MMLRPSGGVFTKLTVTVSNQMAKSLGQRIFHCAPAVKRMGSKSYHRLLSEHQQQGVAFSFLPHFSVGSVRLHSSYVQRGLTGYEDRYSGIHFDVMPEMSVEEFDRELAYSLANWTKGGKAAVWVTIPIERSHYIPVAAKHGLVFHHAEGDSSTLCKWLKSDVPNMLPRFATHQIGAAGCVVREDTKEVLLIQDRNRVFQLWKFPGGLSDLGEDIATTAEREVFEETGIKTEYKGILTFRQQHDHPGAFGRSDIYFLCLMKPLTFELCVDPKEILGVKWMKIEDFKSEPQTSAMTHRVLELLKAGLDQGFDKVTLQSTTFRSIYKGINYKVNHANVGLPELDPQCYAHYISSAFPIK